MCTFEAAVEAIVVGDESALRRLLEAEPALVHARSTRPHAATLLHYLSANGVEEERQKTPPNAASIAQILLNAGADVNATAHIYGHECTALALAATSIHPEQAGILEPLLEKLLSSGATLEPSLIDACLANFRPHAAEFLAGKVGELSFAAAAGLGRLDDVNGQMTEAFLYACEYGRDTVVELLLNAGVSVSAQNQQGQTGLHLAIIGAQLETVNLLLQHHAPLDMKNTNGGTPLGQAIWCEENDGNPDVYSAIQAALLAALHQG